MRKMDRIDLLGVVLRASVIGNYDFKINDASNPYEAHPIIPISFHFFLSVWPYFIDRSADIR